MKSLTDEQYTQCHEIALTDPKMNESLELYHLLHDRMLNAYLEYNKLKPRVEQLENSLVNYLEEIKNEHQSNNQEA